MEEDDLILRRRRGSTEALADDDPGQGCKFTLSPSPMGGVEIFHPSFTLG